MAWFCWWIGRFFGLHGESNQTIGPQTFLHFVRETVKHMNIETFSHKRLKPIAVRRNNAFSPIVLRYICIVQKIECGFTCHESVWTDSLEKMRVRYKAIEVSCTMCNDVAHHSTHQSQPAIHISTLSCLCPYIWGVARWCFPMRWTIFPCEVHRT